MITSTDVQNVIVRDCAKFGIPCYPWGNVPKGKVESERIVVRAKPMFPDTYMSKCFVEVNFQVPDDNGEARLIRLNEIESQAADFFDYTGEHKNFNYVVSVESTGIEEEEDLNCHYVNARLLFEVNNVKK